jgi:hypothetical protein
MNFGPGYAKPAQAGWEKVDFSSLALDSALASFYKTPNQGYNEIIYLKILKERL